MGSSPQTLRQFCATLAAKGFRSAGSLSAQQPRKPSRNAPSIFLIQFPKLPFQSWFFIEHHKYVSGQQHQERIDGNADRLKHDRLSYDHQRYSYVHWVPHILVQGRCNQKLCRRDWGRSTKSTCGKLPCATKVDHAAYAKHDSAEPGEESVSQRTISAQQPAWHDNRNRTRDNTRKDRGIYERPESLWHGSPDLSRGQDIRPNVTVKSITAEEYQDAALTSSRVDPDNSIHLPRRG